MLRQFELVELVKSHHPDADEDLLNRSYVFSMKAHGRQMRGSGDPYFSGPTNSAGILAGLGYNDFCVASALMYYVIEDTGANIAGVRDNFELKFAEFFESGQKLLNLTWILFGKQINGKIAADMCISMFEDVSQIAIYIASKISHLDSLSWEKDWKKIEGTLQWSQEFILPLAERSGLHEMAELVRDRLKNFNVEESSPSGTSRAPSLDRYTPDTQTFLEEKNRVLTETNLSDKEIAYEIDNNNDYVPVYKYEESIYDNVKSYIDKNILPENEEIEKHPARQFEEFSSRVRTALSELQLPEDAVEAATVAAVHAIFSQAAKHSDLPQQLPTKVLREGRTFFEAPGRESIPLYGEREDKSMDAIAFYERYWRPYENAGLLTRANLKHFNESLISAVRYQCKRDDMNPDSFLPPTISETVDEEIAATGLSHRDIRRFARHLDRRAAKEKEADGPA